MKINKILDLSIKINDLLFCQKTKRTGVITFISKDKKFLIVQFRGENLTTKLFDTLHTSDLINKTENNCCIHQDELDEENVLNLNDEAKELFEKRLDLISDIKANEPIISDNKEILNQLGILQFNRDRMKNGAYKIDFQYSNPLDYKLESFKFIMFNNIYEVEILSNNIGFIIRRNNHIVDDIALGNVQNYLDQIV